ncbi:MAG: ASCH domain-containing protein [Anaerolineae bacterium]|nr:ASCH domain-containing protein [Anaerolineae bacterium]
MKALSFHQPRAEQVIRGEKSLDVRTWQASHRGVLAVHASAERRDERCRALGLNPAALAYGALLGTVELTGIVPLDEAAYEALRGQHRLDAPFPGAPCYGWRLANPCRFEAPIPCRGQRRLFDVEVGPGTQARQAAPIYRVTPPPQPDPARPFALYTIPDKGNGYRVALYQWLQRDSQAGERAPGALWSVELGGDPLRAVADHLLAALRANSYKATDLARAAGAEEPFYLDELTGLRLALILLAVKPLTRHERIEAIGLGVQAMSAEEAYYWFSKCSAGPGAARAQKALRILLAGE